MCLKIGKNQRVKIAKTDIICYKFLERNHGSNQLLTPYKYSNVEIGETYTSELVVDEYLIDKAIHSFVTEDSAIWTAKYWLDNNKSCIVAECIIPKGSKYFKGVFDFDTPSFASNCIKYLRIIHCFEAPSLINVNTTSKL